jgi:hypothetical protein
VSACVEWQGYGHARNEGRVCWVHRTAYEAVAGAIPAGLLIHHICENPSCVNPDHLMAVTPKHHKRLHTMKQTHCKSGHEFTPENTYIYPRSGKRACRACVARWTREYRQRQEMN